MIEVLKYILKEKTEKYRDSINEFKDGNVDISGYDSDWDNILELIVIFSLIFPIILTTVIAVFAVASLPALIFGSLCLFLLFTFLTGLILFIVAFLLNKYYEYKQEYLNSRDSK